MRIALLQASPCYLSPPEALSTLDAAAAEAAAGGASLLVTPELFLTGYGDCTVTRAGAVTQDGPELQSVGDIAKRQGMGIVLGYPEKHGAQLYNSAVCFTKTGDCAGNYRKRFLANEYERACFTRGNNQLIFEIESVPCALSICYDLEFPETVRHAALEGAMLLIVPTALRAKWRIVSNSVLPARAYENGIYIAYCNYADSAEDGKFAGLSAVCGPSGSPLARAETDVCLIFADIDLAEVFAVREELPFLDEITRAHSKSLKA